MKKFLLLLMLTLWGFSGQSCNAGKDIDDFDDLAVLEAELAQEESSAVEQNVNSLLDQGNKLKELFATQAQNTFVSLIKREIILNVSTTCPTHLLYMAQFVNYNPNLAAKFMLVLHDIIFDIIAPLQEKNQVLKANFDRIKSGFAVVQHLVNANLNNIRITLPMGVPLWGLDDSRFAQTSGHDVITRLLKEGNELISIIEKCDLPHFKPMVMPLKTIVGMLRLFPLSEDIMQKIARSIEKHFTPNQRASIIELLNSELFQKLKKNCNIFLDLRCFKSKTQPSFQTKVLEILANMLDAGIQLVAKAALV